jgi:serine/threonine protein kinase
MNMDLSLDVRDQLEMEIKAMMYLKHQHVLEIIDHGTLDYVKPHKTRQVDFIALQLAERGELFDFISVSRRFDERLARFYFRQFMDGLNFCHLSGVSHRDLKPENLLIDSNYNIRIADFGFACSVQGTS